MRWLFVIAGIGIAMSPPALAQMPSQFGSPFWEARPYARTVPKAQRQAARKHKRSSATRHSKPPKLRSWQANGGARPAIAAKAPKTVPFLYDQYEPGSVVVDTKARKLYYVLDDYTAYQYPVSVGRKGFTWTGEETVTRIQAWPDWRPPEEMRLRDRRLPERMTGGLSNPLGAKAIYLGDTLYRIHGTNQPKSIGRASSSGCFRMRNAHVMHLASAIEVGARVYVLKSLPKATMVKRDRPDRQAHQSTGAPKAVEQANAQHADAPTAGDASAAEVR